VTNIKTKDAQDPASTYEVTVDHWEPACYLDNTGTHILTKIAAVLFVMAGLLLFYGFHAGENPILIVGAVLVVWAIGIYAYAKKNLSKGKTIGNGGKLVSVPQMHLGGQNKQ